MSRCAGRPLVYVHTLAPPTPRGTGIVIHRLLSSPGIPPLLIFADRRARGLTRTDAAHTLPGTYHWFSKLPTTGRVPAPIQVILGAVNLLLATFTGIHAGHVARRAGAGCVLSGVDGGFSQIAGAIAARRARIPHIIWALDLWQENAYPRFEREVAARLERRLWRGAAAIIVHAQELADHYRTKHGVACEVLPIPIEGPARAVPPRQDRARIEVMCAGDVYWAQLDALQRLVRARHHVGRPVTLTLLTHRHTRAARDLGVDRIEHAPTADAFRHRVAAADVLFLGLSFSSPRHDVIRYATPARFPEYLASGVPVVVHAPADSHVARQARDHDVAEVVDVPDEFALAAGIRRALDSESQYRAQRSQALALEHDSRLVSERLIGLLDRVAEIRSRAVSEAPQ